MIEQQISKCGRSLIIFEEADKLPEGLLDVIVPYIDHHQHVNGVDYRDAMFILIR